MKLSTLKKLSTKRWRSKSGKGSLTLTSISLAGNCFEEERRVVQKMTTQHSMAGSLTSSLSSMYSSELEFSSGGSLQGSASSTTTSRSSSMVTTSSADSSMSPSWSDVYLPYLDEDCGNDDDLQSSNERTLFMGKNSLTATRPVAV